MKIDNALNNFCERYDREAMESIERISKEIGPVQNDLIIPAFNIKESFDICSAYLRDFGEFVERSLDESKREHKLMAESTAESMHAGFERYFNESTNMFTDKQLKYNEFPEFVSSYIEGIQNVTTTVNEITGKMIEEEVRPEIIASVSDFTDMFMERMDEHTYPVVDKMLWASGYTSKKRLAESNHEKVVFA